MGANTCASTDRIFMAASDVMSHIPLCSLAFVVSLPPDRLLRDGRPYDLAAVSDLGLYKALLVKHLWFFVIFSVAE